MHDAYHHAVGPCLPELKGTLDVNHPSCFSDDHKIFVLVMRIAQLYERPVTLQTEAVRPLAEEALAIAWSRAARPRLSASGSGTHMWLG